MKIQTDFYQDVLAAALHTAKVIRESDGRHLRGHLKFVFEEAGRLLEAYPGSFTTPERSETVFRIFLLLQQSWNKLATGEIRFDQLVGNEEKLWEKFMTELPLGAYGEQTAQVLKRENLLHGDILELGAGVGNTSRHLTNQVDPERYMRTDLNIKLMKEYPYPSKISLFDFNREGRWENLDLIFAVNALHCASDKCATLKNLHRMLKDGGSLVLGEGSPYPVQGKPWALNYLCGFFDGWWDQGGFLTREEWKNHLQKAGFKNIQTEKMSAGENDLGGVIWAQKII